jgi:hypothetical protein
VLLRAIKAVQAGGEAPHVIRDPAKNRFDDLIVDSDVVPNDVDWRMFVERAIEERRPTAGVA